MFGKEIKNAEFVEIISCFLVICWLYVTQMCVYPHKCRIQPRTMSQVTIYTPLPLPRTHTRKATASVHVSMQLWLWWRQKCDDGRDWVGNIQGGGQKFLGDLIRHCRSRLSSESSKQGHTKRINPTISRKSEFYSIFLSFIVRILHSNIRSGSSFWVNRARFPSADVVKKIELSHFQMLPSFARYNPVWVTGMIFVAQSGVLNVPGYFFPEWKKRKEKQNKNKR